MFLFFFSYSHTQLAKDTFFEKLLKKARSITIELLKEVDEVLHYFFSIIVFKWPCYFYREKNCFYEKK
jgi:hypothetical protein